MTRTMQHRNVEPRRGLLVETGNLWVATRFKFEGAWDLGANTTGWRPGPTGAESAARVESTAVKVGKVSWVASALPHSEGAAYKRQGRESVACLRDWRMGS